MKVDPKILVCPSCHSSMAQGQHQLSCTACNRNYPITDRGQIQFLPDSEVKNQKRDFVYKVKTNLQHVPFLWWLVKTVLSSSLLFVNGPKLLQRYVSRSGLVLNIGSGATGDDDNVINLDIRDDDKVEVICDAHTLPFANNSVEGVISMQVFEHCKNPSVIIKECNRVLRVGGYFYMSMPFVFEYHSSPDDYYRWTQSGLKELFKDWKIIECGANAGPASAWYTIFRSFLAVALSFGSRRLYYFWLYTLALVLWPLKLLDFILIFFPTSEYLFASGYIIGQKPE